MHLRRWNDRFAQRSSLDNRAPVGPVAGSRKPGARRISLGAVAALGLLWLSAVIPKALAQQPPSILGTWTTSQPGQGGMVRTTIGIGGDGTYAYETQLPNGSRMRVWGTYRATPVSANAIRVTPRISDWRPHRICTQAVGLQPRCGAFQPPPAQPTLATFTGPDTFQVDGHVWSRDPTAALLRQPVPDPLVQYAEAPVAPTIPHPNNTAGPLPRDPRAQYEQGNQNFLNGYMRGCTMIDGRWQNCQQ